MAGSRKRKRARAGALSVADRLIVLLIPILY